MLMLAFAGATAASALEPVQLWADFGSSSYLPTDRPGGTRPCPPPRGNLVCGLSDEDAAFIAKTYAVVSLEKCFGVGYPQQGSLPNHTMENFAITARQITRLAPPGVLPPRVLFYWSSSQVVGDCYENDFGGKILQHPEWWLRNKTGGAIWMNPTDVGKRPTIDFTVPAAREWWTSVPLKAHALSNGAMAGVFVDSAGDWGDTFVQRHKITTEKAAALNSAHRVALGELRAELRRIIGPRSLLVGNALGANNQSDGVELLQQNLVDGVCSEHFGAFDWLKNQTSGEVDATKVRAYLDHFDAAAKTNGSVFVKAWVGPETSPIDSMGPSWPTDYKNPISHRSLNRTAAGIAEAAGQMLNYSLACFLCIARPNFRFSYGWWYDVSQGYIPGADAPADWYPQLSRGLGKATSPAKITGRDGGGNQV